MNQQSSFWGNLSAFLALTLDNVGNLVFLSSILIFTFHYPADLVLTRMLPGTALGVLFGDVVYTWLAVRLNKRTGRNDVTAMPLGLDTPSTIGIAYAVLGPAYLATNDAVLAWKIGMANLFLIGIVKLGTSFIGGMVQRIIPPAGLLGSIAGIGLLFLGFLPLIEIFNLPIVGMVALGLMFYVLVGKMELPFRLPGILIAVVLGSLFYNILGYSGYVTDFQPPSFTIQLSLPYFSAGFFAALPETLKYIPLAIPFGIITIIGGINNTESARLAGDTYRARSILLTEAFSTLIAAFFGGVAQTTPYIGHPAYKKMGATNWYTLATGLFIGIGTMAGLMSLMIDLIPKAVLAPIFIFIGFEIISQAYASVPPEHSPAVTITFFPTIANMVLVILNQFLSQCKIPIEALPLNLKTLYQTLTILGNGFILTAMLWGGMLSVLISKKPRICAVYALACASFTLCGLMHSVFTTGEVYMPWSIQGHLHWEVASAYFILAFLFWFLSFNSAKSAA
jgi:AGZA family xanthine/uracil permease-like MFS transporter